jgi:hypothetical protein
MKKSVKNSASANVNTTSVNSQVSTIHEGLIQNGRVILGNDETFGNFKADNPYEYNGIKFTCTEVVTKGIGNHTKIVLVREDTQEVISGDIDDIKAYFGVTFKKKYNTKAKTPEGRIYNILRTSEFVGLIEESENEDLTKYWRQLYNIAKALNDEKVKKIEEEEKAKAEANKETNGIKKIMEDFGVTEEQAKAMYMFNKAKKANK